MPLGSRPTALVLSGGAALGAWQAGCLYALAEKRIPFHSVFGASIGALNGLAYAQDTMQRMWKVWNDVEVGDFFRMRPRLFPPSLFCHDHLRSYLTHYVDEERAKSLRRCWLYVISADVASGRAHQACYSPEQDGPWDGPILDHVLGSISIPFVLPPVRIAANGHPGRILLDGVTRGFVDLFPALERGVKDILFLNVVHPSELITPQFGLRSYLETIINQLLEAQVSNSVEAVRRGTHGDLRVFVFHPSKPLKLKPLKFEKKPCRDAFTQGAADAESLLATPEAWRVL